MNAMRVVSGSKKTSDVKVVHDIIDQYSILPVKYQ